MRHLRQLSGKLLVRKPKQVGCLEFPIVVFNGFACDRMPSQVRSTTPGNDEEALCIRLKRLRQYKGLVQIEFGNDSRHVGRRLRSSVSLRGNVCKHDWSG